MIIGRRRFNIYLSLFCATALFGGCAWFKKDSPDKQTSTLRIHLEVLPDNMDFHVAVPVYREKPVLVNVDKAPFLTEANVEEAKVVDVLGGFDLQIKFDRQGGWILENYTTTNPGKHLAIFATFGRKSDESRWLAAPVISRRLDKAVLTFTPDASREEAERIARGLNNAAKEKRKKSEW